MKLTHKIQVWIADRVSSVQYPEVRPADAATRAATRTQPFLSFKHKMPIGKRIDLFLWSMVLLFVGLAALFVCCLLIYVVIF